MALHRAPAITVVSKPIGGTDGVCLWRARSGARDGRRAGRVHFVSAARLAVLQAAAAAVTVNSTAATGLAPRYYSGFSGRRSMPTRFVWSPAALPSSLQAQPPTRLSDLPPYLFGTGRFRGASTRRGVGVTCAWSN